MKYLNLSTLQKGKIVIDIIDESKEIDPVDLSDKFFRATYSQLSTSTLEKYALEYLDSLSLEIRMSYLNDIALRDIFPTFTLAKMICLSSLSKKEFCKVHKVKNNTYDKAKKYAESIIAYQDLKRKKPVFKEKSGIKIKRIGSSHPSYNGYLI